MKKSLITIIILITLIITGCKDDNPVVPILTGKINAKVNGNSWTSTFASATIQDSTLVISGTNSSMITLSISGLSPKTYEANIATSTIGAYSNTTTPSTSDLYTTNSGISAGGEITLAEIDTVNKFVSGSFSFKVINASTSDSKTITEGTFTKIPLH